MTPMQIDLPYLMLDHDRHGNLRIYVRRNGRKVRLREKPGSEAFARAYSDALHALDVLRKVPLSRALLRGRWDGSPHAISLRLNSAGLTRNLR